VPDNAGAFSFIRKEIGSVFCADSTELLLAVLFAMGFCCFFSVVPSMDYMSPGRVSVMCRLLVMSAFVVLRRFIVMLSSMRKMF
jgi:hypothetical protein